MKKITIISRILSVVCCIMMATSVCNAQSLTKGFGTESDPYQISNQSDLETFAKDVNSGISYKGKFIKLTDNIVCNYNKNNQWTPIGNYNKSFQGTFDGNGKTISGLYYDNSYLNYIGLFGNNQGTIKNVGVVDSYFNGQAGIGGVCGYNEKGSITNCYNTGEVSGKTCIGGVCGENFEGTITNCYNTGEVSGGEYSWKVGGVCGVNNGTITNCYNTGEVSGMEEKVGGVCGENYEGTITNCYNTGEVSGNSEVGGVCGYNEGTIENCYNTGVVSGSQYFGGVCGDNYNATITNCYYLSDTDNGKDAKIKEQFNNGFVAYKLSQADNGGVWGQDLSNPNSLPTLYGSKVYETNNKYVNSDNGFLADNKYEEPRKDNNGVYLIANAGNLYWFADYVNQLGDNLKANAILANDIVVNTLEFKDGEIVTDGKDYRVWSPIGYYDDQHWDRYYYQGTFDGKGHTISGLYINEDNSLYIGLFREIGDNSTIKNVGVVDSYFKVTNESGGHVGSISGSSKGKIINCYSNSTIVAPKYNNVAGGICGNNNSSVQNCYFVGSIICNDNSNEYERVGGICGGNNGGQFVKCYYLDGCCQYTNGYGSAMTIIQFNSGEVAYNFGGDWGQDLSTQNTFPVLNGKKVYKYDGSYTNEKITDFDENGFLKIRDGVYAYQEPEVIDGVFQIANAGNLYWFAEYVNDGHNSINAVLTNDIVVNENVLNDDGTLNIGMTFMEWTPIGYSYYDWDASKNISMAYQGNFDGQGHIVKGLYLNKSNQDYVSLFGYNEGTIQNVGVVDSYFYGKYNVGGVCGCTDGGKIKNCFSSATVIGKSNVGGVCGNTQGNIENCYNIGSVSGIDNGYGNVYVGGVVGYDLASGSLVKNCYTTGIIKENGIKINKVLGDAPYDAPVNCYYLADTEDGKGGMTAEQFASGEVAYKLGDAFFQTIGKDALPVLDSKHDKVYKTSPCTIEYSNKENTVRKHVFDENGFCRCGGYQPAEKNDDGYYKIANVGNLYWFAEYVNQGGDNLKANAILMDDIEVNKLEFKDGEIVTDGKDYRVWSPIGYYDDQHWDRYYYQGTFDGNGHTISGLYFNNDIDNIGLFGYNEGTIKDVGVVDSYFYGKDYVGGVCGDNINGTIKNCYNMSMVSGNYYIGGVCGANCGTLENCHNIGAVSGNNNIGGVCGYNYPDDEDYDQTIITCYNMGKVSGIIDYIGGVCGRNEGLRIINSYNTGAVSGRNYIGGISGDNYANSCGNEDVFITNCYNIGEVKGTGNVGSLAGDNNGSIHNCYYLLGDDDNAIQKTAEQFANGEVAKLLRDGEKGEVWGQDCSKENSLPDLSGKLFYKIEFVDTDLKSVKFDNSLGYTITEQPSKTGTTFSGWYNNPEFKGDVITSISANTVKENIKLYPKFIINTYKVTFDIEGVISSIDVKYNEKANYDGETPTKPEDDKNIYTFSGWKSNIEGITIESLISSDVIFTAQFTSKSKPNGGNGGNGTPVSAVDDKTIKIWGYDKTIYINTESLNSQIQIFDLAGHLIKSLKTTNSHNEIQINKSGIFVVVIDNKTSYKVAL